MHAVNIIFEESRILSTIFFRRNVLAHHSLPELSMSEDATKGIHCSCLVLGYERNVLHSAHSYPLFVQMQNRLSVTFLLRLVD